MAYLRRRELSEMLENEVVLKIAGKYGKTPAQVLLRFVIQQNVVVIPKSTNLQRVAENIQVNKLYSQQILKKSLNFIT